MADTVVLPHPAETSLGASPSLRLTPQDPSSQHAASRKSKFHEEPSALDTNDVGQPDRLARDLAAQLPLKEQVSLLAGSDFWRTVALPHRGVPSIKTTDGPNGARGQWFKNGTPAALFPCGISLAATWNLDLMEEVGKHLGDETKARGADVLLAPTVCLHRSPLGGRNFESFSEDPFLTGKLSAAYIRGLQSKKVAATIKHFVGNEQETLRMTIDSIIAERPLRELYLKPFEIAIREASPWALMSSYNLVNGVHADQFPHTLKKILRDEWKYDGMVMSDWTGTNSVAEAIAAGCALEMPGPTKWRGERAVRAVEKGKLSAEDVERAAGDILYLIQRTKGFNNDEPEPEERANDNPAIRQVIRQAGAEGLTLLKNERGLLPITSAKKIAVVGPNAKRAIAGGGGSASLNPHYTTTPFEGLAGQFDGELIYSRGCDTAKWLPLASPFCTAADGKQGVTLEYYYQDRFEGSPASVQHKANTDLFLWDSAPKAVLPAYSFKVKTTLTPKTSGNHTFSFSSVGPGKLFLNGELFIDNWDWTEEGEAMFEASEDVIESIYLEAGKPVQILVESTNEVRPASKITHGRPTHAYGGCRIGYEEESRINLLQEAVDAAKEADAAVVFVGLDAEWESEGYDRQTMDLPKNGSQDRLVEAVLAANPNTIVVNQSGTPVTMPWAEKVPTILQAWYQGQEAGNALADILLGRVSPGGKLPTTFPKKLSDNPAYHNWPGENAKVVYGEGIFIGYRHYERCGIEPLFPFGHGLSYTTFSYGNATTTDRTLAKDGVVKVTVPVTNTGSYAAAEIVQGYIKDVKSKLPRPEKELQAFDKVFLEPGETKTVELAFDKYAVGYYDTSLEAYIAEEGRFEILIGSSSADISL
ncbi:glycoside hydrolase family 3 protein [Botryosphaeria dothidea]|uniref:beta-glucosidase n=1 Tax=Botryosphaeria dothidea TaxID=55169 RepID=A0A8H4IWT7_9PEZI|nr:glycoside hydrolase family 3 protein [Botryosphaeria dothidea]